MHNGGKGTKCSGENNVIIDCGHRRTNRCGASALTTSSAAVAAQCSYATQKQQ